jgi:uncharacterized repeat protein (TIGR03833 family)
MAKKPAESAPIGQPSFANNPFAKLSRESGLAVKPPVAQTAKVAVPVRRTQSLAAPRLTISHVAVGRSGKVATRISGVPVDLLEKVAARLAKALGCAAEVDGGDVLLAGSLRERASEWFQKVGDVRKLAEEKPAAGAARPEQPPPPALIATNASGTYRRNVKPGMRVAIVLKADQPSGELTVGVVRDLLTSADEHPRGIKVCLVSGQVGRVQVIYA